MGAKIRKGDLVEVISGRTSDPNKMDARNRRRVAEGYEILSPGDKGKRGRVMKVFPDEGKVLVEGVNLKTRHVRPGRTGKEGGILTVEAPIAIEKVAFVDPNKKKPVRVGFREDTVERDGRTRTVRTRVARGGSRRGIEPGKELDA